MIIFEFFRLFLKVTEDKKNFYKQFLYEPFPVESKLLNVFPDHLNAEIVAGTVQSLVHIVQYINSSYFIKRLHRNPSFYGLPTATPQLLEMFMKNVVDSAVDTLLDAGCIRRVEVKLRLCI